MDTRNLIELLRATIESNPYNVKQAEEQLRQMHKTIGFVPTLLQVVMQNNVDLSVRETGVTYLKKFIVENWQYRETEAGSIREQDRPIILNSIIEAIVLAPETVRVQLADIIKHITNHDQFITEEQSKADSM